MKIQDFAFFAIILLILFKKNSKWAVIAGILSLFISIPFFAKWIFFTAERLTVYAAGFFLIAIVQLSIRLFKNYENWY